MNQQVEEKQRLTTAITTDSSNKSKFIIFLKQCVTLFSTEFKKFSYLYSIN
jgi:hypothetical protein